MYVLIVLLLTVLLPTGFSVIEIMGHAANPIAVFGKWFLFWGMGVRLATAGLSQILKPSFTVQGILGEANPGAEHIAQELGFANLAMGLVAVAAPFVPGWQLPLSMVGALFLGLAGIRHLFKRHPNLKERVATGTDLLVAAVLAVYVVWYWLRG